MRARRGCCQPCSPPPPTPNPPWGPPLAGILDELAAGVSSPSVLLQRRCMATLGERRHRCRLARLPRPVPSHLAPSPMPGGQRLRRWCQRLAAVPPPPSLVIASGACCHLLPGLPPFPLPPDPHTPPLPTACSPTHPTHPPRTAPHPPTPTRRAALLHRLTAAGSDPASGGALGGGQPAPVHRAEPAGGW